MKNKLQQAKLPKGELLRKKWLETGIKIITEDFGERCPDHEEECIVCTMYKVLDELKRQYEN
jgi:hypothetical protein